MLWTQVLSDINLLAVLIAGIVHIVLGLVWFQPKLFGNAWVKLSGKEMKPATQWIPAGMIAHLFMTLVLAVIVKLSGITTALQGAVVGILVCLGFVATLLAGELVWEKIPFRLYLIRVANQLVGFAIAGIILSTWR